MYKRLTFKRDPTNEERILTPFFILTYGTIRGVIVGNTFEVISIDGSRVSYAVAKDHASAKKELKQQLKDLGVEFLDEVRLKL